MKTMMMGGVVLSALVSLIGCSASDASDTDTSEAAQTSASEFAWATCGTGAGGTVSLRAAADASGKLAVVGIKGEIVQNPGAQ